MNQIPDFFRFVLFRRGGGLPVYLGHVLRIGDNKHTRWRLLIDGHDIPARRDKEHKKGPLQKTWKRWKKPDRYGNCKQLTKLSAQIIISYW